MTLPSPDGARRSAARVRPVRALLRPRHMARIGAMRAVLAIAGASAGACGTRDAAFVVERAAVTLPAGGAPALVFFTVRNAGAAATLVGVEIDAAARTTMQSTTPHRMPEGSAAMGPTALLLPVPTVEIGAASALRFAPGGFTGVVEALRRPLARGDSVRLTLRLADGRSATAMARVLEYADLDTALAAPRTVGAAGSLAAGPDREPSVDEGREIHRSDGCASCHGSLGHGDGPVSSTLSPRPRDFRDAGAFKNGTDVAAIAQTLATGIPGGGSMPLYAHLTDRERRSLALYVISLRSPLDTQDSLR